MDPSPSRLGIPSFPMPGSQQRLSVGQPQASARVKVALKPGRSLMDWIRLGNSGKDLTGLEGKRLDITTDELAKHNTQSDCWMAINGQVYNVTQYLEYHPGGADELMRGAGQDGTLLFNEVHRWVNYESMLAKCLVGKLTSNMFSVKGSVRDKHFLRVRNTLDSSGNFSLPLPVEKKSTENIGPRYDWFQTEESLTINVYTKHCDIQPEHVIIDKMCLDLMITAFVLDYTYTVHFELEYDVKTEYSVRTFSSGKIEITFYKSDFTKTWKSIGKPKEDDNTFVKTTEKDSHYRECTIMAVATVTHNTNLYTLGLPEGTRMCVPIGHHVHVKASVNGMEISRSYTCIVVPAKQDSTAISGRSLHLMIKIYPDGALTPTIGRLQEGDTLFVSNPEGTFKLSHLKDVNHLVMLAAGTGFTPMVRLIWDQQAQHSHRQKKLIFFNKTENDILFREKLDELVVQDESFEVIHVLSEPSSEWSGLIGRICSELLKNHIPAPSGGNDGRLLFCICGPIPFTQEADRLLKSMGHNQENIHLFLG